MASKTVLTVDLGAESGRVIAVGYHQNRLTTQELCRFSNPQTVIRDSIHWDFLHLWREIEAGIEAGRQFHPAGIGVDAWGVDFALLDRQGQLIGNPVSYRDARTEGMMEAVFAQIPRHEVFSQTGIQFMRINTLYQLMSLLENGSSQLTIADCLLMVPDLVNYWLTGIKVSEFTVASTSQMLNPRTGGWADSIIERLGLPVQVLPEIVQPGTRLETYQGIPVIAPATHDTGSAVAAVPARMKDFAYISSGTWSLVGLEVEDPIVNEDALAANVTNEGGVYGTFRLLKNVMGLWLVQQCRMTWAAQNQPFSYPEMVELASQAAPLLSFIDPDDPAFLPPGDHPRLVQELCARTGQVIPESKGAILRTILESLAMKYRETLQKLGELSGQQIEVLHIVGGGSQNDLLNQMTADATGLRVMAGPVEATVLGNALVQFISLGEIGGLEEGRQVVEESGQLRRFEPQRPAEWDAAYKRYLQIVKADNHDS